MMQSKTRKILFYTDTPLYGGAEKQMQLLAENLPKNYQPVFLIRKNAILEEWSLALQKKSIEVYQCPSKSKNSISNWLYLVKIIKEVKPVLIHAHLWNPMACKYIYLAKKKFKIPLVVTEHDPFQLKWLKSIYKKVTLNFVNHIITVSNANKDLMLKLYPNIKSNLTTIHNGIAETNKTITEQQRKRIRKEIFGASEQNQILLSVGTLHERKGHKYLISAFQKINKKFPSTRLIIAGEGPERANLEKLIKNLDLNSKVKLLGQRLDINELMESSDLFILPSLKEAFGLVILEAFSAKMPVIASSVGGIPEIITNNINGLLIKPANKFALEKAINNLLQNQEKRQKLAQNASQTLRNFTASKMALSTANIYNNLIEQ